MMIILYQASKAYGVDKNLLLSIAAIESGGNVKAVSPVGAGGLTQFMPATAQAYGMLSDNFTDDRFDPQMSIMASAAYVGDLLEEFNGNEMLALASYNYGETRIRKLLKENKRHWPQIKDNIPNETKWYVVRGLSRKEILDNHMDELTIEKQPLFSKQYELHKIQPGENLFRIAMNYGIKKQELVELNPELKNQHKINMGYKVRVPK